MRGDACGIRRLKLMLHATSWSKTPSHSCYKRFSCIATDNIPRRPSYGHFQYAKGYTSLSSLNLPTSCKLGIVSHNVAHFVHLAADGRLHISLGPPLPIPSSLRFT